VGDAFEPNDSGILDSSQFHFTVPPQACLAEVDTTITTITTDSIMHNMMEYRAFQHLILRYFTIPSAQVSYTITFHNDGGAVVSLPKTLHIFGMYILPLLPFTNLMAP
jgi:hypothetical protein